MTFLIYPLSCQLFNLLLWKRLSIFLISLIENIVKSCKASLNSRYFILIHKNAIFSPFVKQNRLWIQKNQVLFSQTNFKLNRTNFESALFFIYHVKPEITIRYSSILFAVRLRMLDCRWFRSPSGRSRQTHWSGQNFTQPSGSNAILKEFPRCGFYPHLWRQKS